MSSLRMVLSSALCIVTLSGAAGLGQSAGAFSTVSSSSGQTPQMIYAVDVNNDGIPDLIQDTVSSPIGFTVSLANGDGSFRAPVTHALPSSLVAPPPMAFADFNGDGKVDIVLPLGGDSMAVYPGNGDGTFQSPQISAAGLPAGYSFQNAPLVAADFNHDGKIDVVAIIDDSTGEGAVVLQGDGRGGLTYKGVVFDSGGASIGQVVTGDFDSDNNADVALTTGEICNSAACNTVVHVLYGNGSFGFEATTPYSAAGGFSLSSGDLNSDGRTDLFGYDGSGNQLELLYGQTGRTFLNASYGGIPSGYGIGTLAMADFNGDGQMDLVGFNSGYSPASGAFFQLAFFLAGGSPGEFTTQTYTLPYYTSNTNVAVGDFNGDRKPDVAIVQSPNPGGSGAATISAGINETAGGYFGSCNYPKTGQGIRLCSPSGPSSANPVSFQAAANSFGQIRKFELWLDGKKIADDYHSWGHYGYFDLNTSLPAGSHHATLNVTTIDNDAMDYGWSFTTE